MTDSNRTVAEVLTEAIKLPESDAAFNNGEQHEAVEREKQAYIAMHALLLEQYAGEHVAIHAGQIVDHDGDGVALSRRIYARFPHEFVWIAPVKSQPIEELRFRSPRLESAE